MVKDLQATINSFLPIVDGGSLLLPNRYLSGMIEGCGTMMIDPREPHNV